MYTSSSTHHGLNSTKIVDGYLKLRIPGLVPRCTSTSMRHSPTGALAAGFTSTVSSRSDHFSATLSHSAAVVSPA